MTTSVLRGSLCVGIIGSGPGGLALALGLQRAGITVRVFEKDVSFHSRKQGYGLTMQQGQRALQAFQLADKLEQRDTPSSSHYIFNFDGTLLGFFGPKFHMSPEQQPRLNRRKRHNVHTPRQQLRQLLLDQLKVGTIEWNRKFSSYDERPDGVRVVFDDGHTEDCHLLVGCDGIYSSVRKQFFDDRGRSDPLNYLGVLVVLGIVHCDHPLVHRRVWQTVDGTTRLFAMPFTEKGPYSDEDTVMWQLSFPMDKERACWLSKHPDELRAEIERRCGHWHDPVPRMLRNTKDGLFSGTPVYDREPLGIDALDSDRVTLVGDAAHPMSPFKGQGANQALLDALQLSQNIISRVEEIEESSCESVADCSFRNALVSYGQVMAERSISKVLGSRALVKRHHTPIEEETLLSRGVNLEHVSYLRAHSVGPSTPDLDDTACRLIREYDCTRKQESER